MQLQNMVIVLRQRGPVLPITRTSTAHCPWIRIVVAYERMAPILAQNISSRNLVSSLHVLSSHVASLT